MATDLRSSMQATLPPFWRNLADVGGMDDANNMSEDGSPVVAFAIRSTVAGSIKVTNANGKTAVMNFTAGESRPAHVVRIWSTGGATIAEANLEVATQQ